MSYSFEEWHLAGMWWLQILAAVPGKKVAKLGVIIGDAYRFSLFHHFSSFKTKTKRQKNNLQPAV